MIYIDRMTNYFKYINKKDLEKFSDLFDDASVYYNWNTVYSGKPTITYFINISVRNLTKYGI